MYYIIIIVGLIRGICSDCKSNSDFPILIWSSMKKIITNLRKFTHKKSFFRKIVVFLCDKTGGHTASNDVGYAGGGMLDTWCKHCDCMFQIPVKEKHTTTEFKNIMTLLD